MLSCWSWCCSSAGWLLAAGWLPLAVMLGPAGPWSMLTLEDATRMDWAAPMSTTPERAALLRPGQVLRLTRSGGRAAAEHKLGGIQTAAACNRETVMQKGPGKRPTPKADEPASSGGLHCMSPFKRQYANCSKPASKTQLPAPQPSRQPPPACLPSRPHSNPPPCRLWNPPPPPSNSNSHMLTTNQSSRLLFSALIRLATAP